MFQKTLTLAALAALATVAFAGAAAARDQIRIVGSTAVYPFATVVAETFGKTTDHKTPVIESTGSGSGLKLFCAGKGVDTPDITNASRAIKQSEIETCAKNGVESITEVKIGYDGIVMANALEGPDFNLSNKDIFLALAKTVPNPENPEELIDNPYKSWSDVRDGLPAEEIKVMGPPPTSGTRDAFVELGMEPGCEAIEAVAKLEETDKDKFKAVCGAVREDGAYVETGEIDTLIIQKLVKDQTALGIFGFSLLDQARDNIKGAAIDDVTPTFEAIADGSYPMSRPLFFYVKNEHRDTIPGMNEYLEAFVSDQAMGPDGYLVEKGLIPMDEAERAAVKKAAMDAEDNVN